MNAYESSWANNDRTFVGFVLLIATKILGKTQISQLTPFDFISAIVIGELVGNTVYDPEVRVGSILYAVLYG